MSIRWHRVAVTHGFKKTSFSQLVIYIDLAKSEALVDKLLIIYSNIKKVV